MFIERLNWELGEDVDRIQQAIRSDTEGTPTSQLKPSIQDQIGVVRDKIITLLAKDEIK